MYLNVYSHNVATEESKECQQIGFYKAFSWFCLFLYVK
jgi:hypothetical protein